MKYCGKRETPALVDGGCKTLTPRQLVDDTLYRSPDKNWVTPQVGVTVYWLVNTYESIHLLKRIDVWKIDRYTSMTILPPAVKKPDPPGEPIERMRQRI